MKTQTGVSFIKCFVLQSNSKVQMTKSEADAENPLGTKSKYSVVPDAKKEL